MHIIFTIGGIIVVLLALRILSWLGGKLFQFESFAYRVKWGLIPAVGIGAIVWFIAAMLRK